MMLGTRQAVRCRGSFHRGGPNSGTNGTRRYQKKKGSLEMTVPEFAMPPDAVPGIAQVIVKAWNGDASLSNIMDRVTTGPTKGVATITAVQQATDAINAAAPGFNLKRAVIISEHEHDDGYTMEFEDDVVFVLPRKERVNLTGSQSC
jgi:hypothetical protein